MRAATSHNSSNTDTHFVEKDYCIRSIVFCRREMSHLIAAKNNGGVTAHVSCNCPPLVLWTRRSMSK